MAAKVVQLHIIAHQQRSSFAFVIEIDLSLRDPRPTLINFLQQRIN